MEQLHRDTIIDHHRDGGETMSEKRDGYITWDEYFMGVAKLSAMRSKDPNTQVGACIVSQDNKILSMGYNGFPKGCSDDEFPWGKGDPDEYNDKYVYVTHSELNAILNYRGGSLEGSKLYVTLFPCNECAKAIIQAGIRFCQCLRVSCFSWHGNALIRPHNSSFKSSSNMRFY